MSTTQAQWLQQVGSVLETLNEGVVISDEDRRIVFANSMFLEMGRMSAENVVGRSVMDLYPPDEVGRLRPPRGRMVLGTPGETKGIRR